MAAIHPITDYLRQIAARSSRWAAPERPPRSGQSGIITGPGLSTTSEWPSALRAIIAAMKYPTMRHKYC
jgi:hypothetical protein